MLSSLPISEASNLAIHSLVLLHLHGENKRISVTSLSGILEVSKSHLAKVMQRLVKAGFVDSEKGAKGGFKLVVEAKNLTLYQIISVFDGELHVEKCLFDTPRCEEKRCIISSLQEEVSTLLVKKLKIYNITNFKVHFKNKSLIQGL
jgi:Rrf2 family protein